MTEPVVLPFAVGVAQVDELRDGLVARLAKQTGDLPIDAGDVEVLDTAGLQLLCALTLTAAKQDVAIRWVRVSDALDRAAALAGLRGPLCLPGGDP